MLPGCVPAMSFDFVLTERFVWSYCGVIVAFALGVAVRLVHRARVLHAQLRALTDELGATDGKAAFASVFEQYNGRVEAAFGLPWTEFVETLVLPAPGSSDPIRNTGEVSRHLNDSTIIFPWISFGFYQSVPNLLTGLGILGTFIGLAVGVGAASAGLSSGAPSEITSSLQQLLDGASLAFLTSIRRNRLFDPVRAGRSSVLAASPSGRGRLGRCDRVPPRAGYAGGRRTRATRTRHGAQSPNSNTSTPN